MGNVCPFLPFTLCFVLPLARFGLRLDSRVGTLGDIVQHIGLLS